MSIATITKPLRLFCSSTQSISIWTLKFLRFASKFAEINEAYHHCGRFDYIFYIYNDNPSGKDTERLLRCNTTSVVLSSVKLSTPIRKDMTTFWPSSQNKVLLEILIYNFLRERSLERHEEPTILSQLCMDNNEWQCIKIHNGAEDNMQQLESPVEEADLRIPMHVLDCLSEQVTKLVLLYPTILT